MSSSSIGKPSRILDGALTMNFDLLRRNPGEHAQCTRSTLAAQVRQLTHHPTTSCLRSQHHRPTSRFCRSSSSDDYGRETRREAIVISRQPITDLLVGRGESIDLGEDGGMYFQGPTWVRRMNVLEMGGEWGAPVLSPNSRYIVVAVNVLRLKVRRNGSTIRTDCQKFSRV